jgi:SAM-dependent methyltransferase
VPNDKGQAVTERDDAKAEGTDGRDDTPTRARRRKGLRVPSDVVHRPEDAQEGGPEAKGNGTVRAAGADEVSPVPAATADAESDIALDLSEPSHEGGGAPTSPTVQTESPSEAAEEEEELDSAEAVVDEDAAEDEDEDALEISVSIDAETTSPMRPPPPTPPAIPSPRPTPPLMTPPVPAPTMAAASPSTAAGGSPATPTATASPPPSAGAAPADSALTAAPVPAITAIEDALAKQAITQTTSKSGEADSPPEEPAEEEAEEKAAVEEAEEAAVEEAEEAPDAQQEAPAADQPEREAADEIELAETELEAAEGTTPAEAAKPPASPSKPPPAPPPPPRRARANTPPPVHVDHIAAALTQPRKRSATGPQPADGAEPVDEHEIDTVAHVETPPPTPPSSHGEIAPPTSPTVATPPTTPAAASESSAKPRKRRGRTWFDEIFNEDFLRTLPEIGGGGGRQAAKDTSFIEKGLAQTKGSKVLDLGCGSGRHAVEMASRGYQVVGLDLSLPFLLRAAEEAQKRGVEVAFVHGDMRELDFQSEFDGVYCYFTTFGYFDDETNRKVVQKVAQALKPGGRLVLDVVNRDYVIADLPTRLWWEGEGCVVLEEVDFNFYTSRVVSHRSLVFQDGRQLEQEISIRAYSLHEIGKVLHTAGFRVLEVSGGLSTPGRFFGAESRQLIIVAEKRADARPVEPVEETGKSGPAPALPST